MQKIIVLTAVLALLLLSGCIQFPVEEEDPFAYVDYNVPEPSLTGEEAIVDGLIELDLNEEPGWVVGNVSEEAKERSTNLSLRNTRKVVVMPLIGRELKDVGRTEILVSNVDVNTFKADYTVFLPEGNLTGSYNVDLSYNYRFATPYNWQPEDRHALIWLSDLQFDDLVNYTTTETLIDWRSTPTWFTELSDDYIFEGADYVIRADRTPEGLTVKVNGMAQEVQCIRATDILLNEYWILDNKTNPIILKLEFIF